MRGTEDLVQDLGGHRGPGELTSNIPPTMHKLVKAGHIHPRSLPGPPSSQYQSRR
jgi:hypothetical protein